MKGRTNEEWLTLVDQAVAGSREALEKIAADLQGTVFNFSLRMLGSFADAEDAAQEILMKVMTHLADFRRESAFSTWVFSIAANHLKDYKKHMFAERPLNFAFYADDIENADITSVPDMTQEVDKELLAEELKLSCTNVMLQCLDSESRCIFVLGTMFRLDSRLAGEILGISADAYRQRLSRVRKKMADFLSTYCGEYGQGKCRCRQRLNYAIQSRRLRPDYLPFATAKEVSMETMLEVKAAMESIDDLSQQFSFCKTYQSPETLRQSMEAFLTSSLAGTVRRS